MANENIKAAVEERPECPDSGIQLPFRVDHDPRRDGAHQILDGAGMTVCFISTGHEDPDKAAALAELIAAACNNYDRLQQWVNDLQGGMYINCVYCGHRYGPKDETPVAMADVLKEHIEQCPEHPCSKLKAENESLRAMYDNKTLVGWFDPQTKRFCYADEKQAYPGSCQKYSEPVFREGPAVESSPTAICQLPTASE